MRDVDQSEILAIRYILKLCKDRNWERIPIKIYCLIAIKFIEGEKEDENHPEWSWLKIVGF